MIRHTVHLRFANTVTEDRKSFLYEQLSSLRNHIDGILDFRHATNVSIEPPLVHGFVDLFWFDFRDESVRDAYLDDSTHQAIGSQIVAELDGGTDGLFVCDIEL